MSGGESNTAGEPSGLIIDTVMGIGRDAAIPAVTRPAEVALSNQGQQVQTLEDLLLEHPVKNPYTS